MAQRRHNFISGAAVLALAVAVTKVLGALYKIPLGNLLDKEGMAHFYAAYNIYNLLLVLSTAGLPLALSRLVSRAAAQGRRNAQRRIFRTALALLAVIGAVCSAVMCLFPQVLSGLLHDSLAAPAIRSASMARWRSRLRRSRQFQHYSTTERIQFHSLPCLKSIVYLSCSKCIICI